jgi:hypothetical protein
MKPKIKVEKKIEKRAGKSRYEAGDSQGKSQV